MRGRETPPSETFLHACLPVLEGACRPLFVAMPQHPVSGFSLQPLNSGDCFRNF